MSNAITTAAAPPPDGGAILGTGLVVIAGVAPLEIASCGGGGGAFSGTAAGVIATGVAITDGPLGGSK